jgi:Secretion system C-terminal sorting domain
MNNHLLSLKKEKRFFGTILLSGFFILATGLPAIRAENMITSGTISKILPGATLVSVGSMVIKSGAVLENAGTLILKNNLVNENTTANSLGSGVVEFSGTTNQSISGPNIIHNLTVNNTSGVTFNGESRVNGTLTLTAGKVYLGSHNLMMGPIANIAGTPSPAAMIVVTGNGQLRKEFPSGFTGPFTFPVGDTTGTDQYSPVTLVFTSGDFSSGNYVGVNLANEKYPDPDITGNYLNRYWTISSSGISSFICNATFQYLAADVTGTETLISCTKVSPLPWVTYALTNAATHLLSASGIVSFNSSFTGIKSTTPPANQDLVNITIPSGVTNCYDATEVLTIAGNGNTFIVENNASVTLVAGNMISILPGAQVFSGGYLHGYITTNSSYCGTTMNPLVNNPVNEDKELATRIEEVTNPLFKIYPNPTTDIVILEFTQPGAPSMAWVAIYNMNGKQILQQTLSGETKHQFSLSAQPVGIYVIQVRSDDRMEVAKIVKK